MCSSDLIDRDLVIAYYKRIDKFHTEDIGRGLRAKDALLKANGFTPTYP